MSELRRVLMDEIDDVHESLDGRTPDHCILPASMREDVRLEVLGRERSYAITRRDSRGLFGMQVWFSRVLDARGKTALLVSDEVMLSLFD